MSYNRMLKYRIVGRKLLSRPKRSRNEAVDPYEEEEEAL
jgi:hypothetical protein